MKNYLQRMGRSLQLPVAVLPAAALLVGIGNWWASATSHTSYKPVVTLF